MLAEILIKAENITQTHVNKSQKLQRKRKEKTKVPKSSSPPPVVRVDDLDNNTLAHNTIGHSLRRILGEGVQAHRQYLHCLRRVELR
jgi:DNA-directed RNA polymerase alpha subunit